jgi:glycosyltransferase involved in cell wall biosynthesis
LELKLKNLEQKAPGDFPRISLIICTLNEETCLPHVLPRIPPFVDEIVLVDGQSTDATVDVARKVCPEIKVLCQPGKGKGDALKYGIRNAIGDIIVTLDADGSHEPEEMPRFVEPLLDGYEFAKGSRFLPGGGTHDMTWHRRLGNRAFVTLTNLLFGTSYTDLCYGYNAFWKKAIANIEFSRDGFEDEPMINVKIKKAKLKVVEVPSHEWRRIAGAGKSPWLRQGWKTLKTILRERISQ